MRYSILAVPFIALLGSACSGSATDIDTLMSPPSGGSGGSGPVVTNGGSSGGSGVVGNGGATGGTGVTPTGGVGTGGVGTGGLGGSGGAPVVVDPIYGPREGTFKMLVYSRTTGFRHGSIAQGKEMLQQIATEQGFTIEETETNEKITVAGLSEFEIIFHMNSTGDIFNDTEQAAYEEWMTTKNGAFGGTHSATDTENGWDFYSEVTGQYYNGHTAVQQGAVQFEADALTHPALKGLPNPWQRTEEWYKFDNHQQWTPKAGFKILGRKVADSQPIMWVREWGKFRAFYTALGHDGSTFQDPEIKKHVAGGIMWAVRREHLLK